MTALAETSDKKFLRFYRVKKRKMFENISRIFLIGCVEKKSQRALANAVTSNRAWEAHLRVAAVAMMRALAPEEG